MRPEIIVAAAMTAAGEMLVAPSKGIAFRTPNMVPFRLRSMLKACIEEALATAPEAWLQVAQAFQTMAGWHMRVCPVCSVDRSCPQAGQLLAFQQECLENDRSKRLTKDGIVFVIKRSEVLALALQRLLAIEELLDGMEEVDGQPIDPEERAFFAATWFFDQAAFSDCQRFLKIAREAKTSRVRH